MRLRLLLNKMYRLSSKMCLVMSLLLVFGSSSHMAPAAAGHARLFELGAAQDFEYSSTVTLNEASELGKSVGYQLTANVVVSVVWEDNNVNTRLLRFEVSSPKLQIKSRKAPEPEGFVNHKSQLEGFSNGPFLAVWTQGKISSVYLAKNEDSSFKNIKKGIASFFQFQLLDGTIQETDVSGTCQVTYQSIDPQTIRKTKSDCLAHNGVPFIRQSEQVLSTNVTSDRTALIKLTKDGTMVQEATAEDVHKMFVIVKPDASAAVSSVTSLKASGKSVTPKLLKPTDLKSAVKEFEKNTRLETSEETLNPDVSPQSCSKTDCPSLPVLVKDLRDHMHDSLLGTVKSANSFIKLLDAGRTATKDELGKAFKGAKNREIILQLCDLAGAINTLEAHEVIKKSVNFESEEDLDKTERYLWAISVASHPKVQIIKDLFKISLRPSLSPKVAETFQLTTASLVRRFRELPGMSEHIIIDDVTNSIKSELEDCKTEECKHKNLRALRNLLCPNTIPILIQHAITGKPKTSVETMKTLRAFKPKHWNENVIDTAQKIYFQAGRRYDSSARTLAVDILLESQPRREVLKELIASLLEFDKMFEVKQYLNQRVQQIAGENKPFAEMVACIMSELKNEFNNYNAKAIRGLTTAFTRPFARQPSWNGSLVNIQEVSGGLLKRGIVDVVLSADEKPTSLFTLGLFAGGLSSFVSSGDKHQDSNEVEAVEEEVATAGMELAVLGTNIRPFIFFNGQGELMGHVWSGTAAEKTPAFQALIMTHDHLEHISLQNGLVAQLQLHGAASFDLSGQIQISLWNRNAHSLVEQNAGFSLQGRAQVDTSFIKSQVGFNVGTEVKLNLISDLSFYSGVSLCMQVVQPDSVINHNVHKTERIIGSKHRLRKSKYTSVHIPGRTYVLNQKNNEMCSTIFKDKN